MNFSILVCDDSTVARKQVIRCLQQCVDANIQQAVNGAQAIELFKTNNFDLLCLDLTMPEVDGVQVLEHIKAQKIECFVLVISMFCINLAFIRFFHVKKGCFIF